LPRVRLGFELHALALAQLIEGSLLHGAGVEEHLFASTFDLNEAEPSITDYALDDTYCHDAGLLAGVCLALQEKASCMAGSGRLAGPATVG
jgi:hypothetical protein